MSNDRTAKITWIGEGEDGPQETTLGSHKMPLGEAVEVSDPAVIETARGNRFFKVEGGPPKQEPYVGQPVKYQNLPPSQQDAQGSVGHGLTVASSPPMPPLPITALPPDPVQDAPLPLNPATPPVAAQAAAKGHGKK